MHAIDWLRRLRLLLLDRAVPVAAHANLLWAALTGCLGAVVTFGFREAIHGLQWLLGEQSSLVETARHLPWWERLLLPAIGGLVAGLALQVARRLARGKPMSDYMEAIAIGDGRVPVGQSVARSLSSLVSVASGGSLGREGSMVHLSATVASVVGRLAKFNVSQLRLLVACGAAAGITAAYSAPIAGSLFVAEILLGSIAMESFGPLIVASVVSNATMRILPGYAAPYRMPPFPDVAGPDVALFVVLGVVAGLAAPLFLRSLDLAKRAFRSMPLPNTVRMGLGGLVVGAISVAVPEVWGNGYSVVNSLLSEPWIWTMVLIVLVCKIVATCATVGSGAIGGVFTPTLFVGAALGTLFGHATQALWPSLAPSPHAYTMVGMGAFLAAATQAPLMAIVIIFEMTLSYAIVLPLMLACVVAYFAARLVGEHSMYSAAIRRARRSEGWRSTVIAELVKPAQTCVRNDATFDEIKRSFLAHPVRYLYVLDSEERFIGAIAFDRVKTSLLAPGAPVPPIGELVQQDIPTLTPDLRLGDALQRFLAHRGERLPVVRAADDPRLLGTVSKSDLLLRIEQAAASR